MASNASKYHGQGSGVLLLRYLGVCLLSAILLALLMSAIELACSGKSFGLAGQTSLR